MNIQQYRLARILIAFFISIIVSIATTQDNFVLAIIGVLTGMLFMTLARSKAKIVIDERQKSIREKAAQMTYAIFTPTIGLSSFVLIGLGSRSLYLMALGQTFAYLTLFLIAVYSISYYFLDRKFGGGGDEK